MLRKNHASVVYELMQLEINAYHEALAAGTGSDANLDCDDSTVDVLHVQLSSKSNRLTLGLLEEIHSKDVAFKKLSSKVRTFISTVDPSFQTAMHIPIAVGHLDYTGRIISYSGFRSTNRKCSRFSMSRRLIGVCIATS